MGAYRHRSTYCNEEHIARAVTTKNTFLGDRGVYFAREALSRRIMKPFYLCSWESRKY